jgi:hypothetical protein
MAIFRRSTSGIQYAPFSMAKVSIGVQAALLWSLLALSTASAAMPEYLHTALGKFSPEVPPHWAYSLTTERDGRQLTERFDPSKPPMEQWTLLRTEGREPTADESEKYYKYKASQTPGAMRATFQKSDIEPGTLKLISEDADRAEFFCTFREQSTNADKMMGHLGLRLTVNKHQAYVEKFSLLLDAPYSPVLWVKMKELTVTMNFSPPTATQPSLPAQSSSHFGGRIFLVSVTEDIQFSYFDFAPKP